MTPRRDEHGLAKLVKAAAEAAGVADFASDVVEQATTALGVRRIAVLLAEPAGGEPPFRVIASKGFAPDEFPALCNPDSPAWKAVQSGRAVACADAVAAPVTVDGTPVGALQAEPAEHGELLAALISIVVQRERSAKATEEAAAFRHDVLTALGAGVVATSPTGLVTAWNPKMNEMLGIAPDDALGKPLALLVLQALREPSCTAVLEVLEDAHTARAPMHLWRQPVVKANGQPCHLNVVVTPLNEGLALVVEDVSDRVALETEMDRMRHMAQIGQLTAQIAHELRNPLTSIKGAAQLLGQTATDDNTTAFASIILQEADALNAIADEFLDFARPTSLHLEAIDANDLLTRLAAVWRGYSGDRGVRILVRRDPKLPMIWMDAARMNQVMRNLILNAVQAMPTGGTLSLSARYDAAMTDAVYRIRDTGVGMTEEQRARIFEPFFTTKAKGTGLGLSVVEKLVKAHGGHIAIASLPGKGTTFEIRLPAAEPVQ